MKRWYRLLLFSLGIFIGAAFCMKWIENDITREGKPVSILALELFWPAEQIEIFFSTAGQQVKTALSYHLYFDFIFMAGCFPAIASLCMVVKEKVSNRNFKLVLLVLAFLQPVAWACDITENCYLLNWLNHPHTGSEFIFYHIAVFSKWIIALSALLFVVGVLVSGFARKIILKQKVVH